jgi:predicted RNA-binding protein with PIN domain
VTDLAGPLPEAVRSRVVALGADVVGRLPPDQVPSSLRTVARFAPAKRARLGGTAVAAALEGDAGFRLRVLEAAIAAHPQLAESLRGGTAPPAADPVEVAVLAYLMRPVGWVELVERAATGARSSATAAGGTREIAAAERLREQLSAARTAAREDRERLKAEITRLKTENASLRRKLQEARERATGAESEAKAAAAEAVEATGAAETARSAAEAEARRLRSRLTEAEQALEAVRRAEREGRSFGTARLRLLLDTLTDAAAGVRRELALPAGDLRPADAVLGAGEAAADVGPDHGRALGSDDPAWLESLLALPQVHLVVDGYNVTKLEWGAMPLEAQRARLAQGLSALAARTGAEVTCVFDGAELSAPPTVVSPRGVRVRFSPPGMTADELVRRLVRAEPEGRPVVVVSSDREVADGVRRPGVRPVGSRALLGLLGR